MDDAKTKVIVIGGFLGAGKSTLLKRILSWQGDLSDTVVIVNEFGEVGIDGSILQRAGLEVVELTSGCICCSLKAGLGRTLKRIRRQFKPRRILVETTGVADPTSVLEVFRDPELREDLRVSRVITVLEAELWEARDYFGPIFFNQLWAADLILLNKIDAVDASEIPRLLKGIRETIPHCRVIPTMHCDTAPDVLWGEHDARIVLAESEDRGREPQRRDDHDSHLHAASQGAPPDLPMVAFSFQHSEPMDEACFRSFIEELPWELFRVKGSVRFRHRSVLINHVRGRSEWTEWNGDEGTRLAFVGWKVDAEDTLRRARMCLLCNSALPGETEESSF